MVTHLGTIHKGRNDKAINPYARPRNARRRKDFAMDKGIENILISNENARIRTALLRTPSIRVELNKQRKPKTHPERRATDAAKLRRQLIHEGKLVKNTIAEPVPESLNDMAERLASAWR